MIAGLSKAVTLYLAPLLMLTTLFLVNFAYFAPVGLLHDRVALLTVTPSTSLVQAGPSQKIDGPSIFIGILGSCSRPKNDAKINCTELSIQPEYDLSDLPDKAPNTLLSAPTMSTPAFLAVAISFAFLFFFTFTAISFSHKMSGGFLQKPMIQRLSAWVGFFGFMMGLTSFLIIRMWFGKAIQDFNNSIMEQGKDAPKLIASEGNAFTMVWVGYSFYAIPLVASLAKLNVQATKDA